ncbi:MAG: N-acetylmuramoyl-L-alanine amidase [Candidatus Buchananbacteria bacterium]
MNRRGKFVLLNRDEFKDWLFSANIKRRIKLIQNHHTWLPDYSRFKGDNHFQLLEAMDRSHVSRRLGGIAQNITTFSDGLIALCRSFERTPAGIKGANQGAVCLENLGNFDLGGDEMSDEHRQTIIFVNAALCRKFNLPPDTDSIVYHYWYDLKTAERMNGSGSTKSCPGTNFFGGNSVESAEENFIPLVRTELGKLGGVADPKAIGLY